MPGVDERDIVQNSFTFISDSKYAKKNDTADYVFKMVSPGIKDLQFSAPKYSDREFTAKDPFKSTPYNFTGFLINMDYHFPMSVEVYNKAGQLEKTIVVIDNDVPFSDHYHAGYLGADYFFAENVPKMTPFGTATDASTTLDKDKDRVVRRLQGNRYATNMEKLSKAVTSAYGYQAIPNTLYSLYNVKGTTAADSPFIALFERTKAAMQLARSRETVNQSISEAQALLAEYEGKMNDGLPRLQKAFYYYNSAVCAMFAYQSEKALQYYKLYNRLNVFNDGVKYTFEQAFPYFNYRGQMTNPDAKVVVLKQLQP